MPPEGQRLTPTTMVDISHESLMRVWKRLGEWAREESESAQLYRRLADTARRHEESKAALWRDPDLQFGLDWRAAHTPTAAWAEMYGGGFDTAMAFLDRSEAERVRIRKQEEDQKAAEAKRRRNFLVAVLLVAVIAAVSGWGWGTITQRRLREKESQLRGNESMLRAREAEIDAEKLKEKLKHAEERTLEEAKDREKEHKATKEAESLTAQATAESLIAQIWPIEGLYDVAPVWKIFTADDDGTRRILDILFSSDAAMRKSMVRGYAMRRALSGPQQNRLAIIRAALNKYCTPEAMNDLHRAGACIAIGRSFYPADYSLVSRIQGAFFNNSESWQNIQKYPPSPGKSTYVSEVQSSYGSMLEMLAPADAARFCAMLASRTGEANGNEAFTRATSRLTPEGAVAIAKQLIADAAEAPADKIVRPIQLATSLAAVAGGRQAVSIASAEWETGLRHREVFVAWYDAASDALAKAGEESVPLVLLNRVVELRNTNKVAAADRYLGKIVQRAAAHAAPKDAIRAMLVLLNGWAPNAAPAEMVRRNDEVGSLILRSAPAPLVNAHTDHGYWASMASFMAPPAAGALPWSGESVIPLLERLAADERLSPFSRTALAKQAEDWKKTPGPLPTPNLNVLAGALASATAAPGKTLAPELADLKASLQMHAANEEAACMSRIKAAAEAALTADFPKQTPETRLARAAYQANPNVPGSDGIRDAVRLWEAQQIEYLAANGKRKFVALAAERIKGSGPIGPIAHPGNDVRALEFNRAVGAVLPADLAFAAIPAGDRTQAKSDAIALAVAGYIRDHGRTLAESESLVAAVELLATFRPSPGTIGRIFDLLLTMPEPDRSRALCHNAPTLMKNWSLTVEKRIVAQLMQWPSCLTGDARSIAQAVAENQNEREENLGLRNGYFLIEQFYDWARKHGYSFDANVTYTLR